MIGWVWRTRTIHEQRVQLYRFEEVHDAYLRLMDAVTSIYLPIVTDYVDNCLLLARWEYLCSFVHGYESCCNLLSRLGYSGGDEYSFPSSMTAWLSSLSRMFLLIFKTLFWNLIKREHCFSILLRTVISLADYCTPQPAEHVGCITLMRF